MGHLSCQVTSLHTTRDVSLQDCASGLASLHGLGFKARSVVCTCVVSTNCVSGVNGCCQHRTKENYTAKTGLKVQAPGPGLACLVFRINKLCHRGGGEGGVQLWGLC